ncbi:MAG: MBOAT family protein, partial [Lachnospiraceae bacterium]|nr:MBOAT family protein [Lachnospiraceae bacterium]
AARGLWRFGLGLAKKVLLANTMGELWAILSGPAGPGSVAGAWLGLVAYGLQIYFDFSGYSDMAIGLGRMFGYSYPENFNYPYLAQSVTEFWRRWHMTLSRWFRDYLYIPLGGNRVSPARWYVNLMIVWGATGLWHGASWNFLAWGLFFGVMLMLEKMFLLRWTERLSRVLRHTYALFLVLIGWALFAMADMGDASVYFAALVGKTVPFIASETGYYLSSYLGILVLCVIGATELPKRLAAKIFGGEKMQKSVTPYVALVLLIVLFILSLASLVNGSYNPFLYFRF